MDAQATLPPDAITPETGVRWFAPHGCVIDRGPMCEVLAGGLLIGQFERDGRDRGPRNVLLVQLAQDPAMHLGRLARAFGIGEEYLRLLRRKSETEGLGAVMLGRPRKERITARQRGRLRRSFAEGAWPAEAWRRQPKRSRLSIATVQREHVKWRAELAAAQPAMVVATAPAAPAEPVQLALFMSSAGDDLGDDSAAVDESVGAVRPATAAPLRAGSHVQHLGSWLMLALAYAHGLHDEVEHVDQGSRTSLRIALDAVVMALAIGERTVEGVRRLATPTAPLLLRAGHTPTASFARRRLWRTGEAGGAELMAGMARRYLDVNHEKGELAIFYVDNHLRPYTGQHTLRKGWRMQDRRVLPGSTDYYVHDEDGRPVLREEVPSHDSLIQHLRPIADRLRDGLGDGERILLGFDRAGAYAEELADLRDAEFEFVTYERKPYPLLAASAFTDAVILGEKVGIHESRLRNLGKGRGRVRRIAVLTDEGQQVNLLAVSREPAERLVEILSHRWRQENAFKHGVERWGVNQLDGRRITEYPPGTVIPNPLRRRLDRALRIARVEEGMARRILARHPSDAARDRAERDLAEALQRQTEIEYLRPYVPTHAPIEDTELAGRLVHHTGELKAVVDTIRIVCANAEADLAAIVAPALHRPAEAKKVIRNLFNAPGAIRLTDGAVHLDLAPAANRNERDALAYLIEEVNTWNLTLPGDVRRRPLHLRIPTRVTDPV
jgi:transposase-like protein